eukprot:360147-Chlamydomonas_euryale.AAC.8
MVVVWRQKCGSYCVRKSPVLNRTGSHFMGRAWACPCSLVGFPGPLDRLQALSFKATAEGRC